MTEAVWRMEQGETSKQHKYYLPLSGDGRYSVTDMSVGIPMGRRSLLIIVLYRLLEGGQALDMRQWLEQEDGRLTPTKRGVFIKVDETSGKLLMQEIVRLYGALANECVPVPE